MKKYINIGLFSKEVLAQLSAPTRNALSGLSKTVIFISLLSGVFAGLTAHNLLGYHFLYGFLLMTSLVFFVDRLILMPSRASGKMMIAIRITLAVILSAIHTLSFEALIFKEDVKNYFIEINQHKVELIEAQYEEKEKRIKQEIAYMQAKNDSLEKPQKEWSTIIYNEIDNGLGKRAGGEGDFAKKWEEMRRLDSIKAAPQIAYNTSFIGQLTNKLNALEGEKQAKIDALIDPEDRSLIQTLEALQTLIFGGGNITMMVFYICWFIFWVVVESGVIILKRKQSNAISLYLDEQDRQSHYQKQMNNFTQKNEMDFKKELIATQEQLRAKKEQEAKRLAHEDEIADMRRIHFEKQKLKDAETVGKVHKKQTEAGMFQHEKDKEGHDNIMKDLHQSYSKNGQQK